MLLMNCARLGFLLLALTPLPQPAWSATASIGALKDNSIFQSNANNSAGGAPGIHVGSTGTGSPRRGLIAFDIAAHIPSGATITDVELTMYLGNAANTTSRTIGLHKLSKDWGEGTAGSSSAGISGTGNGFPASPGDATWSHAMLGSVAWSNPGATGDFNPIASATLAVGGPVDMPHTWLSTSSLVSDVKSWLDSPATNFGWALVSASEDIPGSIKSFYSRSATQNASGLPNSLDSAWRPALVVTYIPEPSTALLMWAGSLSLFFKRRSALRGDIVGATPAISRNARDAMIRYLRRLRLPTSASAAAPTSNVIVPGSGIHAMASSESIDAPTAVTVPVGGLIVTKAVGGGEPEPTLRQ
jgi:hypothetical protein